MITGGEDLCLLPPEHSLTVYCDQAHYGPVSGGGVEDGVKGVQLVVGAGRIRLGGDADGGLGGGTDEGGGGYRRYRDGDVLDRLGGYCIKRNIRDRD